MAVAADSLRRVSGATPYVLTGVALVAVVSLGLGVALAASALAVPLAIAFARRPQRGLLLLVTLAPFNGLLLILPLPGFVAGWKEALVIATLAATWLCPPEARAPAGRTAPEWIFPVGGLLLLGGLSAVAVGGQQALEGLKIGFFYLLAALAAWRCPLDSRERDRLVTILMTVGFICSAVGIVQQAVGHAQLHELGYEYNTVIRFAGGHLRSFSTFIQPFPFALFVMLVLLLGIPVALTDRSRLRNRLFLLATPIYLLGLFYAFVRSAWLGLGVGLIYLGVRQYRILLAGIPLALVAFVVFGGKVSEPVLSSTSLHARSSGWAENLSRVRAHPVGVGLGSSGAVAEKISQAEIARTGKQPYQPDNYYFKVLYELGVLGLWMFVLFLVGAFRSTRSIADRLRGDDRALAEGVTAMVLAAAVASLVATYLEIFPLDLLFWLLLAVVAGLPAIAGPGAARDQPRKPTAATP